MVDGLTHMINGSWNWMGGNLDACTADLGYFLLQVTREEIKLNMRLW